MSKTSEAAAPPLPDKPSIAVLPFDNLSRDPEQEYFSDGLTEDLITDLSQLSGLSVTARHAVFQYKGRSAAPQQVARNLGVGYVLEGSVRRAANRVRINAQLIDAGTGFHLWAQRYDRDLEDIFALQDEITKRSWRHSRYKFKRAKKSVSRAGSDNPEAYDLYIRSYEVLRHKSKETFTTRGRDRSLRTPIPRQLGEMAVDLDELSPQAHDDLALIYGYAARSRAWSTACAWRVCRNEARGALSRPRATRGEKPDGTAQLPS